MTNPNFKITELNRRLSQSIQYGAIKEVDYANAKVKVEIGELTSAWIPWTSKASHNSAWLAPEIGEQVVIASPSGVLNQGCIIGSLPQDAHPPAGSSVDKHTMQYGDGAIIEYDRAAHHLKLVLPSGGIVEIVASADVTVKSDAVTIETKNATITADSVSITASDGVSIKGDLAVDGNIAATGTITP